MFFLNNRRLRHSYAPSTAGSKNLPRIMSCECNIGEVRTSAKSYDLGADQGG